ncbi:MAG: hypothetical protein F9B45_33430 [Phycisphaera sp. RhM]|nr:hypothetical protein [Phycisphaera sp. RhM]
MKFNLSPKPGASALPYDELISRLQTEFDTRFSVTDISETDVDAMVAEFIELNAPQQMIADAQTGVLLRISIYDFDFSDDSVVFDLTPATTSVVGHYPEGDTGTILDLLERCAKTLGYSLTIIA